MCAGFLLSFLAHWGWGQRVETSEIPASVIIYREVTGPYSQHPEVFQQIALVPMRSADWFSVNGVVGSYSEVRNMAND